MEPENHWFGIRKVVFQSGRLPLPCGTSLPGCFVGLLRTRWWSSICHTHTCCNVHLTVLRRRRRRSVLHLSIDPTRVTPTEVETTVTSEPKRVNERPRPRPCQRVNEQFCFSLSESTQKGTEEPVPLYSLYMCAKTQQWLTSQGNQCWSNLIKPIFPWQLTVKLCQNKQLSVIKNKRRVSAYLLIT